MCSSLVEIHPIKHLDCGKCEDFSCVFRNWELKAFSLARDRNHTLSNGEEVKVGLKLNTEKK